MSPHRHPSPDAPEAPHGLGLLTTLADQIDIRGLNREDAPLLAAHLRRLPAQDRNARFHAGMTDAAIDAYVGRIDWHGTYVFGAVIEGELRAVAELVPGADSTEAEIAVSVEPEHQHSGLGRLLVLAAILAARRLGLSRLRLTYQVNNAAMRALVRDLGAEPQFQGDQVEATIMVPAGAGRI